MREKTVRTDLPMLKPLFNLRKAGETDVPPSLPEHYVAGLDANGQPIPHALSLRTAASVLSPPEAPALQWECTGCGACCSGPGAVYFTADDMEAIRLHLGPDDNEWARTQTRLVQKRERGLYVHQTDRACILLGENKRCRVYPARPLQCRTYPFWTSCFEDAESFQAFRSSCPGNRHSQGKRYGLRELVARVNATADRFGRCQTGRGKSLYL